MNSASTDRVALGANPPGRGPGVVPERMSGQTAALHRLVASRDRIRTEMETHIRESALHQVDAPGAHRSLGERLLERARRLPLIGAVLEIRDLRRG